MSLRDQSELLEISRSGYYYESRPESVENLAIRRRLDELHLANPVYGSRRLGRGLSSWFVDYNPTRPHQSLGYATPGEVYGDPGARGAQPKKR